MQFFNIDKALSLPNKFKVIHGALEDLFKKRNEEFQKDNPLTKIYKIVKLNTFQKSYTSSTGFKQAFEQTVDYASAPGFTNGDGFKFTVSYKPFTGKVVFTWQLIKESDPSAITDTLSEYQVAWQRQIVEFGIYALTSFFGTKVYDPVSKTHLKIQSADTVDGDPMGDVKNPVFTNAHTVVRREGMSDVEFNSLKQTNKFFIDVKLDGTQPGSYSLLANGLYQIKVAMNKYLDDNGKRAGVRGRKRLVMTEDANLNQAIASILAAPSFGDDVNPNNLNPIRGSFDTYVSSYLDGNIDQPIPQFTSQTAVGHAQGILMLDPEYNAMNKGPIMVERIPFSTKTVKMDDPEGVKYIGKQAFDFFCPSWRGIAYIYIGNPADVYNPLDKSTAWANPATFTEVVPTINAPLHYTKTVA